MHVDRGGSLIRLWRMLSISFPVLQMAIIFTHIIGLMARHVYFLAAR